MFSPTPADAKTLAAAKVVFVNGLGLEGWMTRLVKASGTKARDRRRDRGRRAAQGGGERQVTAISHATDPHAWQSVANVKLYVANIRNGLTSRRSGGRSGLRGQRHRPISKSSMRSNAR